MIAVFIPQRSPALVSWLITQRHLIRAECTRSHSVSHSVRRGSAQAHWAAGWAIPICSHDVCRGPVRDTPPGPGGDKLWGDQGDDVTWGRHPGQPRHWEGAGGGAGRWAGHSLGPSPAPWHAHTAHRLGDDHRLELGPAGKLDERRENISLYRPIPDTTVTVRIGILEHFINITVGNLEIKWNILLSLKQKILWKTWKMSHWKLLSHWSQDAVIITNAQTLYRGISYLQLAFN